MLRSESQRRYRLSSSPIQQWLALFDRDEFDAGGDDEALSNECSARLAALERDVGWLTRELEQLRRRLQPDAAEVSDRPNGPELSAKLADPGRQVGGDDGARSEDRPAVLLNPSESRIW